MHSRRDRICLREWVWSAAAGAGAVGGSGRRGRERSVARRQQERSFAAVGVAFLPDEVRRGLRERLVAGGGKELIER